MLFTYQQEEFKIEVSLTNQIEIQFILCCKQGKKCKYFQKYTLQNIPFQIKKIIQSTLISNLQDFYHLLFFIKNSFIFIQQNNKLIAQILFYNKVTNIQFDLLQINQQQDKQSTQLSNLLDLQQNQFNKNNGKIYFDQIQTNSDIYQGQMLNGLKHGQGSLLFDNGDFFKGQYKYGKRHGYGQYIFANGEKFEGNYYQGKMFGKGKYFFNSGNFFQGFYYKNQPTGPGIYTNFHKQSCSIGLYKEGLMEGRCIDFHQNGDIFEGHYTNDQKNGPGKYYYANGSIFQGTFTNNKMQGLGKKTNPNGQTIQGTFKNGKKYGQFTSTLKNGSKVKKFWLFDVQVTEQQFNEHKSQILVAAPTP